MRFIIPLLLVLCFSSCLKAKWILVDKARRIQHFKPRDQWPTDLKNQFDSIRKMDSTYTNSDHYFRIYWINKKRRKGLYIADYRAASSHFGKVSFFVSNKGNIQLLNRDSLNVLSENVKQFMAKNNFSKRKTRKTLKEVEDRWNILSTDSW